MVQKVIVNSLNASIKKKLKAIGNDPAFLREALNTAAY